MRAPQGKPQVTGRAKSPRFHQNYHQPQSIHSFINETHVNYVKISTRLRRTSSTPPRLQRSVPLHVCSAPLELHPSNISTSLHLQRVSRAPGLHTSMSLHL